MPPTQLSLPARLDNGLTKAICVLLRWFALSGLWLLGLLILAVMPFTVFVNDEGLSDISLLEAGSMLLMLLLLWRHTRYCRYFQTGFWHGLNRVLLCQGAMGMFTLLIIGLVTATLLHTDYLQTFILTLQQDTPVSESITHASVLLAFYLAVPTANTKQRVHSDNAADPVPEHTPFRASTEASR